VPYNSLVTRTDVAALIPEEVSHEIIEAVPESSAVMRLARRLPDMSRAQRRVPVTTALATAYFVDGDIGLKQTTEMDWENRYIDAEEIACIVPIPEAVLDDTDYDMWAQIRPSIVEAIGLAFDQAVLYGTGIPASWTVNLGAAGLVPLCTAAGHTLSEAAYADLYEVVLGETGAGVDGIVMSIESDGYIPTGHLAHVSMRGRLRNLRDADGNLIFKSSMQEGTRYELDGEEILFPLNGSMVEATSWMISGDWSRLHYAIRQDITYKILTEAVIQNAAGAIVYNLAQQDMVALRAVMRVGVALPNPINRMNATAATRCCFATLTA